MHLMQARPRASGNPTPRSDFKKGPLAIEDRPWKKPRGENQPHDKGKGKKGKGKGKKGNGGFEM